LGEVVSEESQCKVLPNGTKEWRLNGKLHHANRPAIEWFDGSKAWWLNGKLHRSNGPAIEQFDGSKQWYLNGELLGFDEEGFWALWEKLDNEQRSHWELLQHAPWVKP
jgi:hypothetical protein